MGGRGRSFSEMGGGTSIIVGINTKMVLKNNGKYCWERNMFKLVRWTMVVRIVIILWNVNIYRPSTFLIALINRILRRLAGFSFSLETEKYCPSQLAQGLNTADFRITLPRAILRLSKKKLNICQVFLFRTGRHVTGIFCYLPQCDYLFK